MEPGVGQSVIAQLGVGGALAVIIAWVMIQVFKLFIASWSKQETDRTDAYKTSAQAHATSLQQIAEQMGKLTVTVGERVADALNDVRMAITRLEGKIDAALDWQERTPVETKIPLQPSTYERERIERERQERENREQRAASGYLMTKVRAKSEPSDR